jgi:hypothetical protein
MMRTYTVIFMLLCAAVIGGGALGAGPDDLAFNTVMMKIDGRAYRFTGTTAGVAKDLGNGTVRLIIGLKDAGQGVTMQISADIPEDRAGEELHLATHFADISMVYKSPRIQFMIAPALQMARNSDMLYYENTGKEARSRIKRQQADWKSLSRDERITAGKGIIRERGMEGSSLFLVIRPVSDGYGQEFRGTFSGVAMVHNGTKVSRRVIINGGQFRVGVLAQ